MSPEERMRGSDSLLARMHAENVLLIEATTSQRNAAEQNKLLGEVALTGRRVNATLAMGRKSLADVQAQRRKIAASVAKGRPANENDPAPQEEMEMNDDSGRTPERFEALHAEIQRRLAALAARRESKAMDGRNVLVPRGGRGEDAAPGPGGAPDSPA
ncbi:hypothetical protein [Caulobacter sp. LARHSG274]